MLLIYHSLKSGKFLSKQIYKRHDLCSEEYTG